MPPIIREFTSDLLQLASMRAFVATIVGQVWDVQGNSADRAALSQLELAVQEAASNIVRHAYAGEPGRPIELAVEADAEQTCVSLHHHGGDIDWGAVEPPVFDGSRTGGFGVYLIEQSVDEASYFRDEAGRNAVRLIKKRASSPTDE